MRTAPGTTRGYEQQNDNAREDIPRELRVRGINEERWAHSVRAEAEQARLAGRTVLRPVPVIDDEALVPPAWPPPQGRRRG